MGENQKLKDLPHFSPSFGFCAGYVCFAVPVGLLISYALPGVFAPFIGSAFLFPLFFYFARSEKYSDTFWIMAWAVVIQAVVVAFIAFVGQEIVARWLYDVKAHMVVGTEVSTIKNLPEAVFFSVAGLVITAVLSFISGGALALLLGVMAVNSTAVLVGGAGSFQSAILVFAPWDVALLVAHTFVAIGAGSLFYMKLESRDITFSGPLRMMILSLAFTVFALFLEVSLSSVWFTAKTSALLLP